MEAYARTNVKQTKINQDIFVSKRDRNGANDGDMVVVEITKWPEKRRSPEGRIVEVLGKKGEKGLDILTIIKKFGLPEEFPQKVLDFAEGIEEEIVVPYDRILYFECQNKLIYVNLEHQKIAFKAVLGELEQRLPSHFVRSHRSFIVNKRKIRDISYSLGEIYLETQDIVPLSRSYKKIIRECGWKYERYHI